MNKAIIGVSVILSLVIVACLYSVLDRSVKQDRTDSYNLGYAKGLQASKPNVPQMCTTWWFGKEESPKERIKQVQKAFCQKKMT